MATASWKFLHSSAARTPLSPYSSRRWQRSRRREGQRALWAKKLDAWYRPKPAVAVRDWPLAADLDNDGRAEIVVPDHVHNPDTLGPLGWPRYGGIRMFDGVTGQPRWDCPLWPIMSGPWSGLIHLLAALISMPTGFATSWSSRDMTVSTSRMRAYAGQLPERSQIYVDAVSGNRPRQRLSGTGALSSSPMPTPRRSVRRSGWGLGSDGWPMLALADRWKTGTRRRSRSIASTPPDPPVVHLLGAATGVEEHTVPGLTSPKVADLAGNGLADLWGEVDGKLAAIRAEPAEAWRALRGFQPAGDLDGDGVSDVVSNDLEAPQVGRHPKPDSGTAIARSGRRCSRILWQALLDSWESRFSSGEWASSYGIKPLKLPAGDLDGDGAPDIVVHRSTSWSARDQQSTERKNPPQALSGRTGRALWSAGALPYVDSSIGIPGILGIDAAACEHWDRSDVFVLHQNFVQGSTTPPFTVGTQARLARLSGRDGSVIWDVLVAEYKGGMQQRQ